MQPLVTIVIIAYNEEKYVCDAIESALAQTYQPLEIILVDDGSKDKTVALAQNYHPRVKVVSQKNSGNCSFPRNLGLSLATGHYVSFLDADDILLPSKIEDQINLFVQYPSAVAVVNDYCNFRDENFMPNHFSTCKKLLQYFEDTNKEVVVFPPGIAADIMLDENFTIASSPLFLASAVKAIGGFCESLYACEDFHLNYRLATKNEIVVSKKVLFHRRLHGNNMSSNSIKMNKFYFKSRMMLSFDESNLLRREKLRLFAKDNYVLYARQVIKNIKYKELLSVFFGFFDVYIKSKFRRYEG